MGMTAINKIKEFGRQIGEQFHAERVILFGSYAQGKVTADSDVDLLVIGPFKGRSVDKSEHSRRGSEESLSNVLNPDASLCVGCAMHTFIKIGGQCPPYQE